MKIKINTSFLVQTIFHVTILRHKKKKKEKGRHLDSFLYTFEGKWVKQTVHNRDKVRKYRPEISKVHENS